LLLMVTVTGLVCTSKPSSFRSSGLSVTVVRTFDAGAGVGALKSPATGMDDFAPNVNIPALALPEVADCRRDHVAVFRSYTPIASRPSPFQSPTTGKLPFFPKTNTPAFGAPAEAPYRSDHAAVYGLNVPMSSWPSPFQSPTTGNLCPKLNIP